MTERLYETIIAQAIRIVEMGKEQDITDVHLSHAKQKYKELIVDNLEKDKRIAGLCNEVNDLRAKTDWMEDEIDGLENVDIENIKLKGEIKSQEETITRLHKELWELKADKETDNESDV